MAWSNGITQSDVAQKLKIVYFSSTVCVRSEGNVHQAIIMLA